MTEICEGCKHEKDGGPNYGSSSCIVCSEYPYDSQYEPKPTVDKEG